MPCRPASARAAGRPHFTPPGAAGAESPARSARASAAARRWEREPAGHGSRRVLLQTLLRAVDRAAAEVSARLGVPTGGRNVRVRAGRGRRSEPGGAASSCPVPVLRAGSSEGGGGRQGKERSGAGFAQIEAPRAAELPRFPPGKAALQEGCGERSRGAGAVGQGPLRAEGREGSAGRGGRARAHPRRPFGQGRLSPGSGGALPGPAGSGGGGPGALCPATAQPIRRPRQRRGCRAGRGGGRSGERGMGRPERSGAAEPGPEGERRGGGRLCADMRMCVFACGEAPSRAAPGTAAGVAVSRRVPPAAPRGRRPPRAEPPLPGRPLGTARGSARGAPEAAAAASGGPSRAVCARSRSQPDPSPRLRAERLFLAALRP